MCGIFGILSQNEDSFNLQNLNNSNHRGPDNKFVNNLK